MALKLSKNVGLTDLVTEANPLTTQHPISGGTQEVRVFLFNDQSTKKYESITVQPIDEVDTNESSWIQLAPDNSGSAGTYLAGGQALTMANINDSNVAKAFWVKVTTPSVPETQNKSDIKLRVNFTEFAV